MPYMTLISLLVFGFVTYIWVLRGFFSSLVHMVCVVTAGAIAFGLWEPIGYFLLSVAPSSSLTFIRDSAWGLALGLPFALSLAVLRLSIDSMLPANAQCENIVDYIGGGVCGAVSGVITAGVLVLSIGFLRVGGDGLAYQAVGYTAQALGKGSMERTKNPMIPWTDRLTAQLYGRLSLTSLRTDHPLEQLYPGFSDVPGAMRLTYQNKSRNTLTKKDFSVLGWYIVGDPNKPTDAKTLMSDSWDPNPQKAVDLSGEPIAPAYIAGFTVKFNTGTREKTGQVIVGSSQVRLVCENADGTEWKSFHPIANVTNIDDSSRVAYARFRYDANEVFIASVGGGSEPMMGFEFALPKEFHPTALYIKNVRWEVPEGVKPTQTFPSPVMRDGAVRTGAWTQGSGAPGVAATNLDTSKSVKVVTESADRNNAGSLPAETGVKVTNAMGLTIQKGSEHSLTVIQDRYYYVQDGEETYRRSEVSSGRGIDQKLRIDRFATTDTTVVVQVDVSMTSKSSLLSESVQTSQPNLPPVLIDSNGTQYEAIGFVYMDTDKVKLRYTLGSPIRDLSALTEAGVSLSRSRPDQKLVLLFSVSRGVKIKHFAIGNTVVTEYEPPIDCSRAQR